MTALELAPEPTNQETLALLRMENTLRETTELLEKTIAAQKALEQRVEKWIGPTMDVAATLHGLGEIVAKLLAASVAQGKAIAALDKKISDLERTCNGVLELTARFDNDPTRRLVKV